MTRLTLLLSLALWFLRLVAYFTAVAVQILVAAIVWRVQDAREPRRAVAEAERIVGGVA